MPRNTPVLVVDGKLPCGDCKQWLPVEDFGVDNARICGRARYCRACMSIRAKVQRERHGDRMRREVAAWRAVNAERIAEYDRNRYWSDPELHRQRVTTYQQTEVGRRNRVLTQQRRIARAKGIENTLTDAEWLEIVAKYGGRCLCCGRTDRPLTRDHVIPLTKGGALSVDNVQPLCGPCNSSKKTKVIDYRPVEPDTEGVA